MKPWVLAALVFAGTSGVATAQELVVKGSGAILRGLDKIDGDVVDMTLANGEAAEIGRLNVELRECRYPEGTAADAYAFLTIRDMSTQDIMFDGWMIASSPALHALEHPRYDVWVLSCKSE